MNIRILAATTILLAPGAACVAADFSLKPDFYGAIAAGRGNYRQIDTFGSAVFDRMVARSNYKPIETHFTENTGHPFAPTLTVGAELGRYLGAEISYINLGHSDWYRLGDVLLPNGSGGFYGHGGRYYSQRTTLRTQGYALSVIGRWPIGENWRIQGRLGAYRSKTNAEGAFCHQADTRGILPGGSATEELCSPIAVTNPNTGEQIGGFTRGTAGNLHFNARSTMPTAGLGVERLWDTGIGFGLEYNLYRTRTPLVADEDATPLPGVRSSETIHFLSMRLSFRYRPE